MRIRSDCGHPESPRQFRSRDSHGSLRYARSPFERSETLTLFASRARYAPRYAAVLASSGFPELARPFIPPGFGCVIGEHSSGLSVITSVPLNSYFE